jgi:hypothetical protein
LIDSAIMAAVSASNFSPALGRPKKMRKSWTISGVLRMVST